MLKMSRDHQSTGLRWSSPLDGVSFGGHGGFLGPFSSSFIFFIISCHVWCCGRRSWDGVYRDQWTMVRTKLLLQEWSIEVCCLSWKWAPFTCLEPREEKRGGKREDFTWVSFSLSFPDFSGEFSFSFFELFWYIPHCGSRYRFGLNGPV